MAITGITLNSVTQVLSTNRIKLDYTLSGTGTGRVFIFYVSTTSPSPLVRVFQLSGDYGLVLAGSRTVYWETPDVETAAYEGNLLFYMAYKTV